MNTKLPLACALVFALAGCSTPIALNKITDESGRQVELKDKRLAEERVFRVDNVLSPIRYLGDENFDSPPLRQFSRLLGAKLAPGKYDLEVTKFRIVDIYPKRLKTTTDAALMGALASQGYATYLSQSSTSQDNITCLVSGSVGPTAINASESVVYEVSSMSALVANDPSFKRAVNECLVRLSEKVAKLM